MQRLRLRFSRGEQIKYISHLDLMRYWERVLHRVGMPLVYSEGFTPHPKISLAAPLPIGVTSEAELMDITLRKRVSPYFFIQTVKEGLPRGIDVFEVREVSLEAPSLQSQVRYAEYSVKVKVNRNLKAMQEAIASLLQAEHLPWQHMRDTGPRHYDLRLLIENLWLIDWSDSECTLGMRLRNDSRGAGRPEQVAAILGLPDYPRSIHRTKLSLAPER
jgi:radical SAM-linked protein